MKGSDRPPPRRKPGFDKRKVGSIRQRFADLGWLVAGPLETSYARDITALNLKTIDFSPLSEFLVGTADPDARPDRVIERFGAGGARAVEIARRRAVTAAALPPARPSARTPAADEPG